ncbi:mitochondrial carrier [Hesseltinella vesiculosa]|uniref:Mitochondrial carrier n=1 Tax=Hesseltinella vesiculosa TaxID=101127 RepID=A0A1X2GMC0_9FUNG|nr:mitochondrial carrier [Hesseltinella vesiculosa]
MLDIDEIPAEHTAQTVPSFFAGLVGGLAGLVVGHPFVKVRLQSRELASRYAGTWNCFRTIIQQEKFFGLYKGMAGVAIVNALVFGSHSWLMELQAKHNGAPSPLRDTFIAGLGAGAITSLVTCPMELAKVQLQSQTSGHTLKGPIDCLVQLYTKGGIRMCFTGLTATTLRELSFGPYFFFYASTIQYLAHSPEDQEKPKDVILAGGVAGIGAWCSTYAADVVKTRIQSEPHRYTSTLHCFRECLKEEGWRVFFRGLTPTIVRAFPSNAATFMAYTFTLNAITQASQKETASLREKAVM